MQFVSMRERKKDWEENIKSAFPNKKIIYLFLLAHFQSVGIQFWNFFLWWRCNSKYYNKCQQQIWKHSSRHTYTLRLYISVQWKKMSFVQVWVWLFFLIINSFHCVQFLQFILLIFTYIKHDKNWVSKTFMKTNILFIKKLNVFINCYSWNYKTIN